MSGHKIRTQVKARLRVFSSKSELTGLTAKLKQDTILAALRLDKSAKYHLLISAALRNWLTEELKRLHSDSAFPAGLKALAEDFLQWIAAEDFCIICSGKKGVVPHREVLEGDTAKLKKIDKFDLLLPQLSVFGAAPAANGVRLSLELIRI